MRLTRVIYKIGAFAFKNTICTVDFRKKITENSLTE